MTFSRDLEGLSVGQEGLGLGSVSPDPHTAQDRDGSSSLAPWSSVYPYDFFSTHFLTRLASCRTWGVAVVVLVVASVLVSTSSHL